MTREDVFRFWTQRPAWMDQAECRGLNPNLFFPERGDVAAEARAVCAECPVQAECRQYAIDNGERAGVWGGLAPKARKRTGQQGPLPGSRPIRHGTPAGAQAHRRLGEQPCTDCQRAATRYQALRKVS